ncbi:GNAT family N-acetyltransferase [Robertmurraya sp. DFI.2.37]|uniref:GNAT family N-acetyltransferase n=1 Tax=Robertmurraya sp. DFI.2.37 TaxID=3031819 RepID=UPI0023D9D116|nr:GNAT family N-acetyltransferase [Robertmurraya sp. DFI.2.37]MDF1510204.1 GNAT family N-acetyltransferase [Robertmurraya sp. DFI.2.37]
MNFFKEAPTLIGTKVTLRNINPDLDNQVFYKIFQEPDMHLWTRNKIPANENETYRILCQYRDFENIIAWSVIRNGSDDFIGTYWIAPINNGDKKIATEAQRIGKKYWRKGFTKEARKLVYDFAFFQLGITEIHAGAWKDNTNSCKSMENIGFVLLKAERKLFEKREEELIENHYFLTKQIWMRQRTYL